MLSTREYILTEEVSSKNNDTDTFLCSRGAKLLRKYKYSITIIMVLDYIYLHWSMTSYASASVSIAMSLGLLIYRYIYIQLESVRSTTHSRCARF